MIRERVFVSERRIPWEVEFDGKDPGAYQVLATDEQGHPIGCGRITAKGMISRISVLRSHRRMGIGALILAELLAIAADNKLSRVSISAKLDVVDFYVHYGFQVEGQVYMQAGIPRQHLSCDVEQFDANILHMIQ